MSLMSLSPYKSMTYENANVPEVSLMSLKNVPEGVKKALGRASSFFGAVVAMRW